MSYTIRSAHYANNENTAAVIITDEAGAVLVSEVDTPELWEQMLQETQPAAFVAPKEVPAVISDRQFFEELANRKIITEQEAMDAVAIGSIPNVMLTLVNGMPVASRFKAKMLLAGATEFRRNHPLVEVFALSQGMATQDVDDFFIAAAKL